MKNKFNVIYMMLAVALLFGCESEPILFDSSKNHVAFTSNTASVGEADGMLAIPVMVAAELNSPAITVDFEIDADQSTAVEGTDFAVTNDSKTLSFPNGWGYDTIWIAPTDNAVFGGNISFTVKLTANSQSYNFGATDSTVVTIIDDEHPLKAWIGTYSVACVSYGSPGEWDEAWTVSTYADKDDINVLWFSGISGGTEDVFGTFDTESDPMTVTFVSGSYLGACYGYNSSTMYYGTDGLFDVTSGYVTKSLLNAAAETPLKGIIKEDGSIELDKVAITLDDYVYLWDIFNTSWTKTAKPVDQDYVSVPDKFNNVSK